jgi:predicted RNase H-like HicB family nuclease
LIHGDPKIDIMKTMTLSAVLNPEDEGYVSLCPELDIASQGDTIEEALANLKEALEGFLETASAEEVRIRLKKPALFTRIEVACADG